MPGTIKMFCIIMNILSHRNNIVLFLACNMATLQNLYSKHCQDKNACGFRKCPYPPHGGLLETLSAGGGGMGEEFRT